MTKRLLIAVALAGCGGGVSGEDPHARATCTAAQGADFDGMPCERGCTTDAKVNGPACTASFVRDGATVAHDCSATLDFEGTRGCCVAQEGLPSQEGIYVYFAECE
jgi:hypothetical protein